MILQEFAYYTAFLLNLDNYSGHESEYTKAQTLDPSVDNTEMANCCMEKAGMVETHLDSNRGFEFDWFGVGCINSLRVGYIDLFDGIEDDEEPHIQANIHGVDSFDNWVQGYGNYFFESGLGLYLLDFQ